MRKKNLFWGNSFAGMPKKLSFLLLLVFVHQLLLAQGGNPIDVKGKVTSDSTGTGLPGASVIVKGTSTGTSTKDNGEFELKNVMPSSILVVSITGYKPIELKASQVNSKFPIRLSIDSKELVDVIVTGFQNVKRNKFSGAAVKLRAEDIKQDGVIDVSRMLEGRAAGVSVQNVSGAFGSAPKIRIRGATSITGENKPLWVVDGVVLEDIINISNDQLSSGDPATLLGSSVAGINANDIESFDILKDASAAAMYGARAMNGVIVITTKKGKAGKTRINYTGNFSTQLKPSYNTYNIMNSADQMSVYAQLERSGYLNYANTATSGTSGVYGKMYDLIDTYDPVSGSFGLANTTEAKNAFLKRYGAANTNWFDILFRNQLMQEHSLSVSSGTDKSQSYFSMSYYDDKGWTIADKVKRYNMNFRNTYNFTDKLSVGFITTGSYRQQNAPGALSRSSNPLDGSFSRDFDINPFSYSLNTSRALTAYDKDGKLEYFKRNYAPFNIIGELDNNKLNLSLIDVKIQVNLNYTFNRHLRYEFIGAGRYVKSGQESLVNEKSNMANAYRAAGNSTIRAANPFLYKDPDRPNDEAQVVLPSGGFYNTNDNVLKNFDIRNQIYYNFNIKKHGFSGVVGQQAKSTDRQTANATGYGYQYEQGGVPFVDYRILKQKIESNFVYYGMQPGYDRFASFFGELSYSFDSRFNLGAHGRYDGSNKLGKTPNARWLPTWTVDGSWNLEQEKFMARFKFLDYLKVRASYGLTASLGNATNSDIILQSLVTSRPYLDEKETKLILQNIANYQLTWEKLKSFNIGLDGSFFNNRLNMSLDFYTRKSFGLIDQVKTSGIGGEVFKNANYADMNSHGVEVMVGGQLVKTKNFQWRANFTMGYNNNKIVRSDNIPRILDLVKPEGGNLKDYPTSSLFSIDFAKLTDAGIPLSLNQDSVISTNVYLQSQVSKFLRYEGRVDPTFTGGLNNSFTWKGLNLNVFVTYQAGNKIRMSPIYKSAYSDLTALPTELNDRWLMGGDEAITYVPAISDRLYASRLTGYPYANYNNSQARVADGGFIRLKTVSLGYQLPQQLTNRMRIGSASILASGYNLWLIHADPLLKGQDPEFFNSGGVAQPIQKQFTLSLRLGI
ncbi:MAG: SusC/RagA family TonB-linked outer membrane protein [Chitinophagaceae bacterium]